MGTPAEHKNGDGQQGVAHTTFAIWILGIVLLILMAAAYVVINDQLKAQDDKITAQDTWRTTEFRSQRNEAKTACEQNNTMLQALQEWARRQPSYKTQPPNAEWMVMKPCPTFESTEKTIDKEQK